MKKFTKLILVVCFLGTLNSYAYIEQMRKDLTSQEEVLEKRYAKKVQKHLDAGEKYEGKKVQRELRRYSKKRKELLTNSRNNDPRHAEINDIESKFKGDIQNTGSNPKNTHADIDFAASNPDSYKKVKQYYIDKGYTVQDDGYKLVVKENDTVVWANEESLTKKQKQAKLKDHDSYNTTGGQHSTGVRNNKIQSSIHGAVLDPKSKMIHALPQGKNGTMDVKTYGKGFAKLQEQGLGSNEIDTREVEYTTKDGKKKKQKLRVIKKVLTIETPLYNQAKVLQNYGSPVEADIYRITDSKKVKKEKMDSFIKKTLEESKRTQEHAKQKAQRKNQYRQLLIDSVKEPELKKRMQERLDLNKQSSQAVEKSNQKDLNKTDYKRNQSTGTSKKPKINKRMASLGVAGTLTSLYQLSEDAQKIKQEGGNRFIYISKDDDVFTQNAKAYGSALVESTPFGGAWNAGVQAEEEEKQRIIKATREGKTINPIISMTRSTGYGLWYLAKGMVTGAFEYTSEKAAKLAWEIKQTNDSYEIEKKAIEQSIVTEQKLALLKEKKKKKVVFFSDNENALDKENAFRKNMDQQRKQKASADNARANRSLGNAKSKAARESDAFGQGLADFSNEMNQMGDQYMKEMAVIEAQNAQRAKDNRRAFDTTEVIRKQNQQLQQRNVNTQASNGFGGKYADSHAQGLQSANTSKPKRNYEPVGTSNNQAKYQPKSQPIAKRKPFVIKNVCGYDVTSSGKWKLRLNGSSHYTIETRLKAYRTSSSKTLRIYKNSCKVYFIAKINSSGIAVRTTFNKQGTLVREDTFNIKKQKTIELKVYRNNGSLRTHEINGKNVLKREYPKGNKTEIVKPPSGSNLQ